MVPKFVEVDRETLFLLPPSVQDWLPKDHLARFVVDVVEQLDLRPLKESYAGRGSRPYNPAMLLALLFYGYANNFECRRDHSYAIPTLSSYGIDYKIGYNTGGSPNCPNNGSSTRNS